MNKQKQKPNQTFNDGIVNIYSIGNIAAAGESSKEGLTKKVGPLRYEERTVGMSRYWIARQAAVQVDMIIRIPRKNNINTQDVAVLHDGKQYQIKQVQYPDSLPPVMDVSLERLRNEYQIRSVGDG